MSYKISIITVVYNGELVIEDTILSIIEQSYDYIEFIVIDGKSTDNTNNIIDKYKNSICTYISERDSGIYDAMNKGISRATGDYITFLNAGDLYIDKDVVKNIFLRIEANVDIVYGDHIALLNGNSIYKSAKEFTRDNLFTYLTATVCHQAIFVKRTIAPFYSMNYKLKSELNWYFDILKLNDLRYVHQKIPVVYYLRGGVGEQKYILNLKEILLVLKRNGSFLEIIKSYRFLIKYIIKILFIITGRYKFEN